MACFSPSIVRIKRKPTHRNGPRIWDEQVVGCGSCGGCRKDQARDWTIRLLHEQRETELRLWPKTPKLTLPRTSFITLTYEEIPEDGALNPRHLSGFIKDLRRANPRLRWFGCGEYGDKGKRPHYHAIVYGPHFLDRRAGFDPDRPTAWRSDALETAWGRGLIDGDTANAKTISYVAGYVQKKISKKAYPDAFTRVRPETGELVNVYPEFTRMSMRPAIGRTWIRRWWRDVYPRDYINLDGFHFKPPRYYDKWMEMTHDPSKLHPDEEPCRDCREHQEVYFETKVKRIEEAVQLTERELKAREAEHNAKQRIFHQRNKL